MGKSDEGGFLSKVWCCLVCYWKGAAGTMKFVDDDEISNVGLACPRCGSINVHPAEKKVIHLPCYLGEIGTVH